MGMKKVVKLRLLLAVKTKPHARKANAVDLMAKVRMPTTVAVLVMLLRMTMENHSHAMKLLVMKVLDLPSLLEPLLSSLLLISWPEHSFIDTLSIIGFCLTLSQQT